MDDRLPDTMVLILEVLAENGNNPMTQEMLKDAVNAKLIKMERNRTGLTLVKKEETS